MTIRNILSNPLQQGHQKEQGEQADTFWLGREITAGNPIAEVDCIFQDLEPLFNEQIFPIPELINEKPQIIALLSFHSLNHSITVEIKDQNDSKDQMSILQICKNEKLPTTVILRIYHTIFTTAVKGKKYYLSERELFAISPDNLTLELKDEKLIVTKKKEILNFQSSEYDSERTFFLDNYCPDKLRFNGPINKIPGNTIQKINVFVLGKILKTLLEARDPDLKQDLALRNLIQNSMLNSNLKSRMNLANALKSLSTYTDFNGNFENVPKMKRTYAVPINELELMKKKNKKLPPQNEHTLVENQINAYISDSNQQSLLTDDAYKTMEQFINSDICSKSRK